VAERDTSLTITWDDSKGGNIDHLAEHGVSPEEFEQVLAARFRAREISESNPRNWRCEGLTSARRRLVIVFEYFEDEHVLNPVTAFEPTRRER
jgi:hypothetical protein